MKFFKVYGIIVIFVGLSYVLLHLFSKNSNNNQEVANENLVGEILHKDQWFPTLAGKKWHVKYSIENVVSILNVSGDMIISQDSTFQGLIEYNYYYNPSPGKIRRDNSDLGQRGNAVINGRVNQIKNNFLTDTSEIILYFASNSPTDSYEKYNCQSNEFYPKHGKKIDFCEKTVTLNSFIGNLENDRFGYVELLKFTKDEIVVKRAHPSLEQPIIITFSQDQS